MSISERQPVEHARVEMRKVELNRASKRSFGTLRDHARFTAVLRPDIPDFVSLPWVNKPESGEFSPEFQKMAAEVILEAFKDKDPDIVLGVGNSGLAFAKEVHKQLRVKNVGRKTIAHGEIKNLGEITKMGARTGKIFTAHSYSRNAEVSYYLPQIPTGKRVLVIDDVSAQGSISVALVNALKEMGADVVGLGVYFNKDWQGGLKRFTAETGVPSFSVIRIARREENGIVLTPRKEALTRFEPVV
ncbi:hypothetical protein IPH70_02505 [Candidatus Roizmanbacteria bacterium]|nr:MAG: hypothetical protein IPH70_02505 [Candidatus Roizmanbacteria bacterium]